MRIVRVVERRADLSGIDWAQVVDQLTTQGWARLRGALAPDLLKELEHAAPRPWSSLPPIEGSAGVRQAGLACHSAVDGAADVVRSLAEGIREGIGDPPPDAGVETGASAGLVFSLDSFAEVTRGVKGTALSPRWMVVTTRTAE